MSLSDLDPTGVLSAAGAAVGLIGAVLRAVPAVKNVSASARNHSSAVSNQGPAPLHRSQTSTEAPAVGVDPERERRAYETVNFVLREFGTRVCAAGLVDEHALTKALTAATQHIEVNLFSGEANRLFASLAPKLADPILVNNVFTSIYFIGALTAELSRSLPNYKETYAPLGPRIVQQLFRTAIGEDAFRENLTANLDGYKTLASTAGLLRPTDLGYSSFPGFPAFSPCRYSSKSFGDVRNHRLLYEKLVRHFDKVGFPQPVASRQGEVGLIREWRFLDADSPSRNFDIEKADKNIGENFGRVIHWLVCSADRLPPGQAVIAYYDQHIELIKWIGQRMGYSILQAASELDLSGPHGQLDKKSRAIVNTWVLLMRSEKAQAARRASTAKWSETHKQAAMQAPPTQPSKSQQPQPVNVPVQPQQEVTVRAVVTPVTPPLAKSGPHFTAKDSGPVPTQLPQKTIDERLDDVDRDISDIIIPQCQRLLSRPPSDPNTRSFEQKILTQHIERGVVDWLDGFPIPQDHPARVRRKAMIVQAQKLLDAMDVASKTWSTGIALPPAVPTASSSQVTVSPTGSISHDMKPELPASTPTETPSLASAQSQPSPIPLVSPPPYSPTTPSISTGTTPGFPFPRKPVVRRKAPHPPKKFIAAKALYDFEPEDDNEEELAFKEGDDIEIVEKTAALEEEGWCRARVKGQKKLGLVPLEYLEIEEKPAVVNKSSASAQAIDSMSPSAVSSPPAGMYQQPSSPSAGYPMDGSSITGIMSPETSLPLHPYHNSASSYQAAHLGGPQMYAGNPGPAQNTRKVGRGIEIAGLGVAVAGTAAGMATFVQGSETQSQNTESTATTGSQPANDPAQSTGDTPEQDLPVIEETVTVNQTNTAEVIDPPPTTDLSAFSSAPFEPQPTMDQPNPVADIAAIDPYFAAQNPALASAPDFNSALAATGVPQNVPIQPDTEVAAPMSVSPFAAQATPAVDPGVGTGTSGLGAPPEPPNLIEDQSLPVTTMTQQSPESAVDNAEWTQREADNQADYAAYDTEV